MRRQRRIPPRGDRAELAAAREIETSECANGNNGGIAWAKARNALQDSRLTRSIKNATDGTVSLNRRLFQRYPPIADLLGITAITTQSIRTDKKRHRGTGINSTDI